MLSFSVFNVPLRCWEIPLKRFPANRDIRTWKRSVLNHQLLVVLIGQVAGDLIGNRVIRIFPLIDLVPG